MNTRTDSQPSRTHPARHLPSLRPVDGGVRTCRPASAEDEGAPPPRKDQADPDWNIVRGED
ncbi:hypothetical protein ACIHCQ_30655 [Streptomyces sp. NPDC052236]|uniref:hypothetical protein n=1 Tax=Streptomyces sp. NPDC052236 TaxID=3365686 RepID=UPI0037CCCFEF